ncbi:hypothetical protein JCM8097_000358 [Rhodosporidiobolus ruineniae]
MLDRLPPELLHQVLDSLSPAPLDRRKRDDDLCRCCLVSQVVRSSAQALVWCDLQPWRDQVPLLLEAAHRNPTLAASVRTLTFDRDCGKLVDLLSPFKYLEVVRKVADEWRGSRLMTAEWLSLCSLSALHTLTLAQVEIRLPPASLVFPSLETLTLAAFSAQPHALNHLLRASSLPKLRVLSLDKPHDGFAYFFPDLDAALLSALEVLQLPLNDCSDLPPALQGGKTPLLVTVSSYTQWMYGEFSEPISSQIQHLCLTSTEIARHKFSNDSLLNERRSSLEKACAAAAFWANRSTSSPPLSLWLSPHLADALGPANEALADLLAACQSNGVVVGWLRRRGDGLEDEAYGAVVDEGVRGYFRALKKRESG